MLFNLDSTLLNIYGTQEGEGYNYHYQAHGYDPLLCFHGLTGGLLKVKLRDGTQYCIKDAERFMILLMQKYRTKYPFLPLYLRGDSGFASPALYEACEENDYKYTTRLKDSVQLQKVKILVNRRETWKKSHFRLLFWEFRKVTFYKTNKNEKLWRKPQKFEKYIDIS